MLELNMKIKVTRGGVCAADDQIVPLEKVISIGANATLSDVVKKIEESKFLQFSSTHTSMAGSHNTLHAAPHRAFHLGW